MTTSKRKIPPHTERVYDLCDVLDAVAAQNAEAADDYAMRLLGQVTKDWPGAADRTLGKIDAQAWRHAYKAATDAEAVEKANAVTRKAAGITSQAEARIEQALTAQRSKAGDELVATVQAALAALDPDAYQQFAAQLTAAASGGRATLTSSGAQSVATKTARRDPIAQALMGDLRSDMIPR